MGGAEELCLFHLEELEWQEQRRQEGRAVADHMVGALMHYGFSLPRRAWKRKNALRKMRSYAKQIGATDFEACVAFAEIRREKEQDAFLRSQGRGAVAGSDQYEGA